MILFELFKLFEMGRYDFVNFLDNDFSTLAGFKGKLNIT